MSALDWNVWFFINSILLGVGLAIDAFSVSLANSMQDGNMSRGRMIAIAGTFGFFQFLMPMIGWGIIRPFEVNFEIVQEIIPWVAMAVLVAVGVLMIVESVRKRDEDSEKLRIVGFRSLMVQGIATSLDALSVGLANTEYNLAGSLVSSLIIGAVTFGICTAGLFLGRRIGDRLGSRAGIVGGLILILIGIEICVKHYLGF